MRLPRVSLRLRLDDHHRVGDPLVRVPVLVAARPRRDDVGGQKSIQLRRQTSR